MNNDARARRPESRRKRLLARLIRRVAGRDQEALEQLHQQTRNLVYSTALSILRNRETAEEAVQDVFLQIWNRAAGYDPSRGNPWAWINTLARSRAIDHLRREKRVDTLDAEAVLGSLPAEGNPEIESLRSEVRSWIASALMRLSPEQRRVIEEAYFRGLSHSEIARRLRIPLGTIKTRIRLAVKRLQPQLAPLQKAGGCGL